MNPCPGINFLPFLRNKELENFEPAVKLILMDCYQHALSQLARRPQLTQYWVPLQRAVESVRKAEGLSADDLSRLGQLVEKQLHYVEAFGLEKG